LSLDESLAGFKQGVELSRQCQSVLDNAQQTVEQLLDTEDEESLKPFEPDA
jgi:exodeoxyribonuclease VII small subunit